MLARYPGYCKPCATRILPEDHVEKLCGKWVHASCKRSELAARQNAAGAAVEIPMEMPVNIPVEYAGERFYRRRGREVPGLRRRRR